VVKRHLVTRQVRRYILPRACKLLPIRLVALSRYTILGNRNWAREDNAVSEEIRIGSKQGSILIEVDGYERPSAEDYDDANWLKCTVAVNAGAFDGNFKTTFTTHDFVVLHERVEHQLAEMSGDITFENTEGDLTLNINMDKRGAALMSGTVHPHKYLEASLRFEFESDQSYLEQTRRQIQAVIRKYPTREGKGIV